MGFRTVNIALSPNNTWHDTMLAGWLLMPWNWPFWRRGRAVEKLEKRFRGMMGADFALAVGSGREALYLILKSLDFTPGDEIIVQSFTCMVVINSIVWNGLVPIYADVDESFNFGVSELKKKISGKTKAVIVQHTFGIPSPELEKIKKVCEENKLILIEDCAHAMGAKIGGKMVGTIGDVGFYSMGRSKIISCVSGGMIVTSDKKIEAGLKSIGEKLEPTAFGTIAQNLLHPWICNKAKLLYFSKLGKAVMFVSQKLKLINLEVTPGEKKGIMPKNFGTKLSNAMAEIALVQLDKLGNFNARRRIAAMYYSHHLVVGEKIDTAKFPGAVFLRYPVKIKNPEEVLKAARKEGIYLGDWYNTPIAPADIDKSKTGYKHGECGNCEKVNKQIINLPTMQSIGIADLRKIVDIVNKNAKD